MLNRRQFLKNASLLTLGGFLTSKSDLIHAVQPAVSSINETTLTKNIGLQIYSLGNELYTDVPNGMKRLSKMGYKTLELAGYKKGKVKDINIMEFKKMADDAGLKITSSHVNPPIRSYDKNNLEKIKDFWKETAEDHQKIGVTYLVQPGMPTIRNVEDVQYVGEVFNETGKIFKDAGIKFGYHNHELEFSKVISGGSEMKFGRRNQGEIVYDLMIKNTDPSLVLFEMDVYWAVMGQVDPVEYMKKYSDRIKLLHIKDRKVLGESGMMNFEQIFKQHYANGYKDYFVELEGIGQGKQFEGIEGCINYLKNASFVR